MNLPTLRGQVDYQVPAPRSLTFSRPRDQVAVAQKQRGTGRSKRTATGPRSLHRAGVADTIEVVQAQESVATASDNLISASYSHNLAKASLGTGTGSGRAGRIKNLIEVK